MKRIKIFSLLSLLVFSAILAFYFINHNLHQRKREKFLPGDQLFMQRAFPYNSVRLNAYEDALEYKAHTLLTENKSTNPAFAMNPWEFCGPTNIGGRITDIEITNAMPPIIYVAAASGGIFKSTDEGAHWSSLFDAQTNLSIGDMAIAPSNEQIIYCGTGEANAGGGSLAYDGNGVYKSNDAGDSWQHLGLEDIGSVGKVLVHPKNPDICYVGAMGFLFQNSPERGVYKTNNGGADWNKILFINDSTGIIDMAMHPTMPDTIYAAAWQRIRKVDRRSYGGPSSGIYRSFDGGQNWEELKNGLPISAGRIGIAIAPSNPQRIFAFYTHPLTGYILNVYRSDDCGDFWVAMNPNGIWDVSYTWWFGKIFVDPIDEDIVYLTSIDMFKSIDGGANWGWVFHNAHVDPHALAIHPNDHNYVLLGNDGGLYLSEDGGTSSEKLNGLPITQFYTCAVDASNPERLYGGAQDNGTNRTMTGSTDDWQQINGGDGFRVWVDPTDNNYIYAESQYGALRRSINGGQSFSSALAGIDNTDRKNWNTPFILDPLNPEVLYYGTNRLYQSTNRAESWEAISPDLTTGPSQMNITYGTITTISVSPLDPQLIYVGTDDGNIQQSSNGGDSWTLVSEMLPLRWITAVQASPNDEAVVYASLSGFRYGTNSGHIYKSNSRGADWVDISQSLPDVPVNDLIVTETEAWLFAATDIGVFYSLDDGTNWDLLSSGLPNVVITDLDWFEKEKTLIAATYGRGIYKISLQGGWVDISKAGIENSVQLSAVPNPFRDHVQLQFSLPENAYCEIHVFDTQGNFVKILYKGMLQKGIHQIEMNANDNPVAVYICKLISDGKVASSIKLMKQ